MQSSRRRDDPLQRARRMAQRSRAATACLPCKASKAKCSDYRPCARCKKADGLEICTDQQTTPLSTSLDPTRLPTSCSRFERELHESEISDKLHSSVHYYHQLHRASNILPNPTAFTTGHPEALYCWSEVYSNMAHRRSCEPIEMGGSTMHPELGQVREPVWATTL
jgi:hypothetical protein